MIKKATVIIVNGIADEIVISLKHALDYGVVRDILINVGKIFNVTSLHIPSCVERTKTARPHYTSPYIFPLRFRRSHCGRPWPRRRFVAGLISRRPGLSPWPFLVGFVVHKVGLEQVFFRALFPLRVSLHQFIHSFIDKRRCFT